MGLYNALFGVNPSAPLLLAMLGITEADVPRFRDCYIVGDLICIHTRTGGGNREYYQDQNDHLTTLVGYVRDDDDSFDCTYADFYFTPLDKFKAEFEVLKEQPGSQRNPAEMWKNMIEKLEKGDANDPDVQRALRAAEPIMSALKAAGLK